MSTGMGAIVRSLRSRSEIYNGRCRGGKTGRSSNLFRIGCDMMRLDKIRSTQEFTSLATTFHICIILSRTLL